MSLNTRKKKIQKNQLTLLFCPKHFESAPPEIVALQNRWLNSKEFLNLKTIKTEKKIEK